MSNSTQDTTISAISPARRTFIRHRGRDAPAASHAVCVRIGADQDVGALAARIAGAAGALPATTGTAVLFPGAPRLWTEQVPCRATDPAADRWRRKEMARPVVPLRDAAVRAVVLRYADGVVELVVVTHRAVLDTGALHGFVAQVLGGAVAAAPPAPAVWSAPPDTARHVADLGECELDAQLDWGLGNPVGRDEIGTCRLPVNHAAGGVEGWATALGIVLARYENLGRPVVAAVVPDPSTGAAGIALVPVDADPTTTLGAVHKRVRTALATSPAWHTEELDRDLASVGGGRFDVGLIVSLLDDHEPVPGVSVVEYEPFVRPPFPVTVSVGGTREPFLRCDFRRRVVSDVMAEQLLRHVRRVHAMLVETPDTPLTGVTLLDDTELAHIAALGRPPHPLSVWPRRIDAAIAEIAVQRPDAVAVCFDGQRLTYAELDRQANRLANGLRALGVADGDRVGVCLERTAELVVALLGVLKAGAAYVPMDPAYPADRLAYTTTDAGLSTVITNLAEFPGGDGVRVITATDLAALADGEEPPVSATTPDDPAYVIYTSGSTGRPKGVVIPHVNVLSLMAATTDDFALGEDDAWTVFHSSAFDFSVWEIWGCLITGGRLVVVPYWVSRSPELFHQLLVDERVTVLSQTPSAFAHLVEVERDGAPPAPVRLVIFGGEGLDPRVLLPWFDRHPETACRVVNMYGITETTVHVTAQTVTRSSALSGSRSVGFALPGWWLRVADPDGRPQPVGVAGEIYVGGAGVALHYLNKPELTEQRFLVDPATGERLYRSGDKGRFLPDGRMEHLGRLDSQVKLRGFRIELDEIRSVLLDDPLVTAAAVVLNQEDPADSATAQLDAYVVLDGESDTAAVRARAGRFLPEYMVPTTVTVLDKLPLTTNGKLDVRTLPKPSAAPVRTAEQTLAEPVAADTGSDFGAALLAAWQDVLGVPVGLDDNFFDLGGNSLFAMRIGAALRRAGGYSLPMRDLYLRPTIRQLTAHQEDRAA